MAKKTKTEDDHIDQLNEELKEEILEEPFIWDPDCNEDEIESGHQIY